MRLTIRWREGPEGQVRSGRLQKEVDERGWGERRLEVSGETNHDVRLPGSWQGSTVVESQGWGHTKVG